MGEVHGYVISCSLVVVFLLLPMYMWWTKDEDAIIWSDQGICPNYADGCCYTGFGKFKKFVKRL